MCERCVVRCTVRQNNPEAPRRGVGADEPDARMTDATATPLTGEALLDRARSVLSILRNQARRAYVLELTGTPKAGKSTSVSVLQTFFRQAGYQVHLLRERAADCPLPMKGHFFFNAWTTATMLAEVLETHESNVDLLILDRGFFDALVWLELQARRNQVTPSEKDAFESFVLLERWRSLVDSTVVMKATPETALKREHQSQIVEREGSLMNVKALAEFNSALDAVSIRNAAQFSLVSIDTTSAESIIETNRNLVAELLPKIEAWADPEVAVVHLEHVRPLFVNHHFLQGPEADTALDTLASKVTFQKRSAAADNPDLVELIGAGVLIHNDRVIVFRRDPTDAKASSYGRHKLWVGCHVDDKSAPFNAAMSSCLRRRIQQDIHLSSVPEPQFLGLVWDEKDDKTYLKKHLGLVHRVLISDEYVARHLENKQFKKMARSAPLRSIFMTQAEIEDDSSNLDLEPWSDYITRNISLATFTRG
jgi:predicted NUDIX family phosphoesterase/predicted ATPase